MSFFAVAWKAPFFVRGRSGPVLSMLDPRDRAVTKAVAGAAYAQSAVAALGVPLERVHGARGKPDLPPSLTPSELLSLSASLLLQARVALDSPPQDIIDDGPKGSDLLEPQDGCCEGPSAETSELFQVVQGNSANRGRWEIQVGGARIAGACSAVRAHDLAVALTRTVELWAQASTVERRTHRQG